MTTTPDTPTETADRDTVWVRTDVDHDTGGYVVTVSAGEDRARAFKPPQAMRYAAAVTAVAAQAEHDAAVGRQTQALAAEQGEQAALEHAAGVVNLLRGDRASVAPNVTYPIRLTPGVNPKLEPFITVAVDGDQRLGQWTPAAARAHAMHVLESVAVADLDAAYYRALRGQVGLDEATARAAVSQLQNHRNNTEVDQ
ncbi:hypothetical protein [Nocardioides marmoraquaticus]